MNDLDAMRRIANDKSLTSPEACNAMRDLIAEVARLNAIANRQPPSWCSVCGKAMDQDEGAL